MKKITLTLFALALAAFAIGQDLARLTIAHAAFPEENAAFTWSSTTFEFGKIKAGTPVTHEFSFQNSGAVPLVISSVEASCGCTVTAYSKDPVAPGNKGYVKVTYNAARVGHFSKPVTVHANTDDELIQLTIKGEVID